MILLSTVVSNSNTLKEVREISNITTEYGFGVVSFSILTFFFIFVMLYFINNSKKITNEQIESFKKINTKTDKIEDNIITMKKDISDIKENQIKMNDILIQITKNIEISTNIQKELEKVSREVIDNNTKALHRNANALESLKEAQVSTSENYKKSIEIIKDLTKK